MNQLSGNGASGVWGRLWARPRSKWLLGIPLGGLLLFVLGLGLYGGTIEFFEVTATTEFCANTCHELKTFVKPSWEESFHFKNSKGVQAGCPNCHESKELIPMLARRWQSFGEVWAHLTGRIDTQAKFDAEKTRMARQVWAYMKATDSRECRTCHKAEAWDLSAQDKSAQKKHEQMRTSGKTCIDCHKGVAHKVPLGADDDS